MEPQDSQQPQPNSQETPATAPAPSATPPTAAPEPSKPAKGYGKRPIWQWVAIYLVAAVVVYGLIYLLFMNKGGNSY